jgi:hypothetical protein
MQTQTTTNASTQSITITITTINNVITTCANEWNGME